MTQLQMLAVGYAFFLGLIAVEAAVSHVRRDGYYNLGELVVNIGHGVVYQVVDYATKHLVVLPFAALSLWVPWEVLPMSAPWAWVLGFLVYDLSSYWSHRHHHEVHALWAIHGVHHAAEDFNFAAALRQPALQGFTGWLWRLPLALVMPARMFAILVVVDFLYQFVLHTRYVGKLGPLEWVLNTPSHHRVHHGRDADYLDCNYGGMLIVWDRLFGTFREEAEEPRYGLTKPLHTLNAVWGNLAIFGELWRASSHVRPTDTWAVWLRGPEALARLAPAYAYVPPPRPTPERRSSPLRSYVFVSAALVPPLLAWMLLVGDGWGLALRGGISAWIVWSVVAAGALLENRRWVLPLEAFRWGFGLTLVIAAIAA